MSSLCQAIDQDITGLTHYAPNPIDVQHWVEKRLPGWCVPGKLMGPDLMTWVKLATGIYVLLVWQAKNHWSGNVDSITVETAAKAINQLSRLNYFSSLVCAYSLL